MSDEREMRLESDDAEETPEDVEAHVRFKNDLPDVRLADDDEGDDVEAHSVRFKNDTP